MIFCFPFKLMLHTLQFSPSSDACIDIRSYSTETTKSAQLSRQDEQVKIVSL